jgi:phosphatidylglycerophosphate synthase
MVADDALLAAFEHTRWPGRGPSSDIALVLAAPVTWMLAGHVAIAVASVVVITALLLVSAWMWLQGEGRDARVVLIASRWTVVVFVALGCLAALGPSTAQPHPPAPSQPAVRPATHAGVVPVR